MTGPALTASRVRAEVAELLGTDASSIPLHDNLFDLGLDSIRMMTLIERWRSAGATVEFPDLAEQPELGHWLTVLGATR